MLYRAALSSLSVARTIALDRDLLLYLESLALRAFLAVYGPRASPLEGLRAFFGHDLPLAVRSARWHILIAALCLLVGSAAGFMLTVQDEAWFSSLVPSGLAGGRGPSSTPGRSATTRRSSRPGRERSSRSAYSPTFCSATTRWSAS